MLNAERTVSKIVWRAEMKVEKMPMRISMREVMRFWIPVRMVAIVVGLADQY